jgi:hypothetical protein
LRTHLGAAPSRKALVQSVRLKIDLALRNTLGVVGRPRPAATLIRPNIIELSLKISAFRYGSRPEPFTRYHRILGI